MKLRLSLLFFLLSAAACFVLFSGARRFRAQSNPLTHNPSCCSGQVGPREVDFPYYNVSNGWVSTLNLVSDSPKPLDFTLAVKSKLGQVLTTAETIQPQAKLAIDLASLITQLGGDPTGAFSEGSVAVYFTGTIMPLVGQITIRNPELSLVHESVMVEHDPGRSDIPAELDGVWWGLAAREARVMVSNTSAKSQTAQVYLDFQGQRHPLQTPLAFLPYETKTLEISRLLATLGVAPVQAPEGGITIVQTGPQPALIANGRISDAATGFSSTIDFPWTAMQQSRVSALHASGLPIGTPTADSPFAGAGTFVPHVVVRNLTGSPQTLTVTVEYPQPPPAAQTSPKAGTSSAAPGGGGKSIPALPVPGDPDHHPEWGAGTGTTVGTETLGPFPVGAYTSTDFSLDAALSQLPQPLPFCSIRIQYSGAPGTVQVQATSVELRSNLVIDSHVQSEGNGWAGSGANPWHLDDDTESILFLTNESDKPARLGFSMTANDAHYYLTDLRLKPHETRTINLRALRDAQLPDFHKNRLPADATDGSVSWIRADNVPVMGRLMVINRREGMASNYDCCTCPCCLDYSLETLELSPVSATLGVGYQAEFDATATMENCNETYKYIRVTESASWSSDNTDVATVDSDGTVTGQGGGTANIDADLEGCLDFEDNMDNECECLSYGSPGPGSAPVSVPTISGLSPSQGLVGTAVSVTINGTGFASGATVNAGSNISVSNLSVGSSTQMTATFTPTNSTSAGGNQSVTVSVSGVASNSQNFFNQVPTSLQVLNVSVLPDGSGPPYGCPGSNNYGIMVDIKYLVQDQNTPSPNSIQSSSMTPHEQGYLYSGAPVNANIGPITGYPTSSATTASDGTFHDVPEGYCQNLPIDSPFVTASQNITMIVGSTSYSVRSQSLTVSAPGSASFGHGTITNGSDINASR